jgi:hypothetical protein
MGGFMTACSHPPASIERIAGIRRVDRVHRAASVVGLVCFGLSIGLIGLNVWVALLPLAFWTGWIQLASP